MAQSRLRLPFLLRLWSHADQDLDLDVLLVAHSTYLEAFTDHLVDLLNLHGLRIHRHSFFRHLLLLACQQKLVCLFVSVLPGLRLTLRLGHWTSRSTIYGIPDRTRL